MLNNVTITGRMASNVDLRKTAEGMSVTNFTLFSERDQKEVSADKINCIAWERIAELIVNYCPKGKKITIVGRLQSIDKADHRFDQVVNVRNVYYD